MILMFNVELTHYHYYQSGPEVLTSLIAESESTNKK